ncbi:PaaI family thioesterase [Hyphococcus formosus]|uniref:PaaI family thioesterase n=1 Tax=Hyphococcus formosus TaxID=3143534 RepID=UPI00398AE6BA
MTDKNEPKIPAGWQLQSHHETFSGQAGPFYFRDPGPKPGVGFFSKPHHANLAGVIHGGALMTLADISLWDICAREVGFFRGLTVTMNSEFLGPGPIGAFIEATGEVTRAGRKLIFARGMVTSKGKPLLSYSGTLKRLSDSDS